MRLFEYQAKELFREAGIPVPESRLVQIESRPAGGSAAASEARSLAGSSLGAAPSIAEARSFTDAAARAAGELGLPNTPVVVKSQLLMGGRGKAGLIKVARSAEEAGELARQFHEGPHRVGTVLLEQAVDIDRELYLAITVDAAAATALILASAEGGVEIEELARTKPEAVKRVSVDLNRRLQPYQSRALAYELGLGAQAGTAGGRPESAAAGATGSRSGAPADAGATGAMSGAHAGARGAVPSAAGATGAPGEAPAGGATPTAKADLVKQFTRILHALYSIFEDFDAELVEINPLFITGDGTLIAGDGKVMIDDNSLFRQKRFERTRDYYESDAEFEAAQEGIPYLQFDGSISLMCAGAGLTTTVFDLVHYEGGTVANYLEFGGPNYRKAKRAMELCLQNDSRVILIVTFGTIARADVMAEGVVQAIHELKPNRPIVTCIRGTNEEAAVETLRAAGLEPVFDTEVAVRRAVELAGGPKKTGGPAEANSAGKNQTAGGGARDGAASSEDPSLGEIRSKGGAL